MPRFSKPIDLAQAQALAAQATSTPLASEDVVLERALGRVLAEPLIAQADVPPFASSAMDGFAVLAGLAGRTLDVAGESRAGVPSSAHVSAARAVRISTGAALPAGATAVIPLEACREDAGGGVI